MIETDKNRNELFLNIERLPDFDGRAPIKKIVCRDRLYGLRNIHPYRKM
jgi:hypothetical protein